MKYINIKLFILIITSFLCVNHSFSQNIFKKLDADKTFNEKMHQDVVSSSQAMQILVNEYGNLKNQRTAYSYSFDDWNNTITKFVKSNINNLPILNANNLLDNNLKVIAFAKENEFLKTFKSVSRYPKIRNPLTNTPSSSGKWNFVETIDGYSGWIFSNPDDTNYNNVESVNRPVYSPPNNYSSKGHESSKSFPWFWVIIISFVTIYLLTKPSTSSSTYNREFSSFSRREYNGSDYSKNSSSSQKKDNINKRVYESSNIEDEGVSGYNDSTQYKGKSWFSEEKTGRIDKDGNNYKGKSWFSEEKTGRIDKDGNIYKGKSWFSEEKTGRIDKDGNVYKGSSWFSEEKTGRSESNRSKNDDSCFLTTSCVQYKNLPDDCYELQVLRNFRDNYLSKFKEGITHLKEYYLIAPKIVNKINNHPEKKVILEYLYECLVIKSIILISENKKEEAFLNYKNITNHLKSELLTLNNSI